MAGDNDQLRRLMAGQEREAEKVRQGFDDAIALWRIMGENAAAIAGHKRIMFLAYVEAGFSEGQALELCKSSTL